MDIYLESAPTLTEAIIEAMDQAMRRLQVGTERQEGEFTAKEFAARHGKSHDVAYKMLERGVQKGVLGKRKGKENLYRII